MNAAEIEELLIKLVQIPAPTGREQKRAEYITDWLKELGYHPFTDAAGNVIVEMKVREGGYTVLMAHMDTVFVFVDFSVVFFTFVVFFLFSVDARVSSIFVTVFSFVVSLLSST